MSTIAERVRRGAAFLDEHDPEWWRADVDRAINLDTLDLGWGDRCILGQRCPLETLTAYLRGEFGEDWRHDAEFAYIAYALKISGPLQPEALDSWAARHGFNWRPVDLDVYRALTAEWIRVISERRSMS